MADDSTSLPPIFIGPSQVPAAEQPETKNVTTSSLESLQNEKNREIMDAIDTLRSAGVDTVVGLPQLVVCGDQSSGKSSVLEAITEIPFPRKENLCTRFATTIVMRRSDESKITVNIVPDKKRRTAEIAQLLTFRESLTDFNQLPNVIETATQAMGLGKPGEANSRAFSRDVLTVEICGPEKQHLTLVDLPGLIHTSNRVQSEADKALILDLVREYLRNPRTIILAVVSAKNDFANQVVLEHCKELDAKRSRTMGIITKPDYIHAGTQGELEWIELLENKNIKLKLGWHVVKNRTDTEGHLTFEERNAAEDLFFARGRWRGLDRDMVGVKSLRDRLSNLLTDHLVDELPSLKEEMSKTLQTTEKSLDELGLRRSTVSEQRIMLTQVSMQVHGLLSSAVKGTYEQNFFNHYDPDYTITSTGNVRRFRAVVQHLNMNFAEDIRMRGQKYNFGPSTADDEQLAAEDKAVRDWNSKSSEDNRSGLPRPERKYRGEAVSWAQDYIEFCRGPELPGTFNSKVIGHLFWEQSSPWEEIARRYLEKMLSSCRKFVLEVIDECAPKEIRSRLIKAQVDTALANAKKGCKEELEKILEDKKRPPMTYNHYFTTTLQKQRFNKQKNRDQPVDQPDMDRFSAEEALDTARAFYKDEMKYFVDVVVKQVTERHLVSPLPDLLLSPLVVARMSDAEIHHVAAEPRAYPQRRELLEDRKKGLEKGLDMFDSLMHDFDGY